MSPELNKDTSLPDFEQADERKKLAEVLMRLFALWNLDTATQLNLLGLSANSRALLSKYRDGQHPLAATRDSLDRAGWLLAIHKALRLLYPKNETLRYSWVKRRNQAFENLTPLEVMQEQGMLGIAKVSRYLDYLRGQ